MTEPLLMRAVQYDAYGPPEVLQVKTVPLPKPTPGSVLVRVIGTSVNAADVLIRSGKIKLLSGGKFPRGTGFDFTGDVVEVGPNTTGFQVGDPVWGFLNGIRPRFTAAAAEYLIAPVESIALRPRTIDALAAASLPGAAGAALAVLRETLSVQAGELVLIRGAGGGVGTAAVQLARAMGAHVTALVRAEHIPLVRKLGAVEAFDYKTIKPQDLGQFDAVFDPVAKNLSSYGNLLTRHGRMAALNIGGPAEAAYLLYSAVFQKRRVRFVQSPPTGKTLAELAACVDAQKIVPVIDGIYPLDELASAHRALEQGGRFGKQVIRVQ